MDALTSHVPRRVSTRGVRTRAQRGDVLLIVLISLMVSLLGLVYAMRDTIISTQVTGNNLAKQKDAQISDVALNIVENTIRTSYGGQVLELSATGQPWWRNVPAGTAPPGDPVASPTYWSNCLGNGDVTLRCSQVALPAALTAKYSAYAVVQPTGHTGGTGLCQGIVLLTPYYYDVFVHVVEASQDTSATTETVFKLCAQ